jgi:hypothetical protein
MGELLPMGTDNAIPTAHLPKGITGYAVHMSALDAQDQLYEIRRNRLRLLRAEFATIAALAKAIDEPASYVSRMLQKVKKGRKNISEEKARKIEGLLGKDTYWLDHADALSPLVARIDTRSGWPFKFPRRIWDGLSGAEKRKAEENLLVYVMGLESQRKGKKDTG